MTVTSVTILPIEPDHIRRPTLFESECAAFLAALKTFRTELNALGVDVYNLAVAMTLNATTSTSTTSLTIGTGTQNLTVDTGKSYVEGQCVMIANTTTPTNYMAGVVTSYTTGTGALVVNVLGTNGSGTFTAWTITLSAPVGASLGANTFTGKQEMPSIKITTGAGAGKSFISDADGDGTWQYSMSYEARTSNTILAMADCGKFIDITSGTFSQTYTAAATLGSGWWHIIRNSGTGTITLDPNGSETIDGVTSGTLTQNQIALIICDGTNFQFFRQDKTKTIELLTSGVSWTASLGIHQIKMRMVGGGAGGGASYSATAGTPGNGAGYLEKTLIVVPGTAYTYSIGAAGTGGAYTGSPSNGSDGGDTIFIAGGVTYTASGGTFSSVGTGTNGDINIAGEIHGISTSAGSKSGDSVLGRGATDGETATGYGSGGAGAVGGSNSAGKNGQPGIIILEY